MVNSENSAEPSLTNNQKPPLPEQPYAWFPAKQQPTDSTGNFTIELPRECQAIKHFCGRLQQPTPYLEQHGYRYQPELQPQTAKIDDVVVTAMGVQRKAKSLSYSTQVVKGEELTKVKDANPINNLTGKVSGVQINRSNSGIGGSVNIVLRGFKSNRNNQPFCHRRLADYQYRRIRI